MKSQHRFKRLTRVQFIRLVRRVLVLISIFDYIIVSFQAARQTYKLSQGVESPLTTYNISTATLINDYVGASTIRESRLLKQTLADDTTPRDGTLYLESLSTATFTGCSVANFDAEMYGNTYLRDMYAQIALKGASNFSHLTEFELILPVVDCTFSPVVDGDQTHARVFYLLRNVNHHNTVHVLTASMATQNYAIPMEREEGACLVTTLTLINDMRAASVEHHFAVALGYPYEVPPQFDSYFRVDETSNSKWILQSIPQDPSQEQTKVIHTATARGIYLRDAAIQSNIKHMIWSLEKDPAAALSVWRWQGRTTLRDNWAWVHYIHALFGLSTLFSLTTLFLIMYRNMQKGKIWIGDAFAQVSSTLLFRGAIVIVTNHFNEYWALTEICLEAGFDIAQLPALFIFPEIMHADLLNLFLCCIDFFGYATKSRIDPAFVIIFELATGAELQNRFGVISDYDNFVYFKGLKFASADGIYSNGFVIANGKFLIATEDILTIIVMKLVRRRLRNVYTYEVNGSKLKQTAQLVYPETISWTDLMHLNVGILS